MQGLPRPTSLVEKTQKVEQTENLKKFEKEIISEVKEAPCIDHDGAPVLLTTPSSPRLQSNHTSPVLQRGRSVSYSSKLPYNASYSDNSSVFTAPRSPILKRVEAKAPKGDYYGNELKALQAEKIGCRRTKMLNKGRSLSMPLPQKPAKEDLTLDKNDPGIETELQEEQDRTDSSQKTGFADMRNHLSIPVNQFQPKHLLSVDHVPFQQSRSTDDIIEALRASSEESQLECQPFMKMENSENKPPYDYSEQAFLAQRINSPRMVRRLTARSRASSMPKLLESSEEKTFANVTAFNLTAQHTALNKPVKFREITEPLKKSKCFHALSTIVSLGQFQTAMS